MSYRWLETSDKITYALLPQSIRANYYNLAVWVKPHTMGATNNGTIIHHSARPQFRYNGTAGSLKLQWSWLYSGNDPIWTLAGTFPLDKWVHLAVTHDTRNNSNKPTVYQNGVPIAVTTTVAPTGTPELAGTGWIGSDGGTTRTWNGWMDDFAIWGGRILAPDEVKSVYLRGARSVVRNQLLYFPMRMVTDGQAKDLSGHDRHGTAVGLAADPDNGFRGLNVGSQLIA